MIFGNTPHIGYRKGVVIKRSLEYLFKKGSRLYFMFVNIK